MKYKYLILATAILSIFQSMPVLAQTKPDSNVSRAFFQDLTRRCGNGVVHHDTLRAVAQVESQFNPYVIGVVNGRLTRQPRNLQEAVQTAQMLHAKGRNFSMGLMQVNRYNLAQYGLDYQSVFDVCRNINTGAKILTTCFKKAGGKTQQDWLKAFSCYYSGNFKTGFRSDFKGQPSYVQKVLNALTGNAKSVTPFKANNYLANQNKVQLVSSSQSNYTFEKVIEQDTHITQKQENLELKPIVLKRKKEEWDIFNEF